MVGREFYYKINDFKECWGLIDVGVIIFYNLCVLGNNVVYEVVLYSVEELILVFEVIDYLLFGVYVLFKLVKWIYGSEEDDDEFEF